MSIILNDAEIQTQRNATTQKCRLAGKLVNKSYDWFNVTKESNNKGDNKGILEFSLNQSKQIVTLIFIGHRILVSKREFTELHILCHFLFQLICVLIIVKTYLSKFFFFFKES